jgi:hypothetical protein
MYTFTYALIIRFLSGFKNSRYYINDFHGAFFSSIILAFVIIIWSSILHWSIVLMCIVPLSITAYYIMIFYYHENKKIHLFEYLLTGSWTIIAFIAGAGLFELLASAILGNALFNMPIQYVTTGKLINTISATDDVTGKTTGIFLFGKRFSIPRISNGWTRFYVGLGLSALYVINHYTIGFDVTISFIISLFVKH